MNTLDEYRQMISLSEKQMQQATELIHILVGKGILLPTQPDLVPHVRTFFESHSSYWDRLQTNEQSRLKNASLAHDLQIRVGQLLASILDSSILDDDQARLLLVDMVQETKPYIVQAYWRRYIDLSTALQSEHFNINLICYTQVVYSRWVIPNCLLPMNESTRQDLLMPLFAESVLPGEMSENLFPPDGLIPAPVLDWGLEFDLTSLQKVHRIDKEYKAQQEQLTEHDDQNRTDLQTLFETCTETGGKK